MEKSGYDLVHTDDLAYFAAAHQECESLLYGCWLRGFSLREQLLCIQGPTTLNKKNIFLECEIQHVGYVSLFCLSVCLHNSKTTWLNFTKFLCTLSVAMAPSISDGVAKYYVLSVFWMTATASFHIGPELSTTLCFEEVRQVAVAFGRHSLDNLSVWSCHRPKTFCFGLLVTSTACSLRYTAGLVSPPGESY